MKVLKHSKSLGTIVPSTILSMGFYDINYELTLNDEDMKKFKINDISNLSTYEDFSFIVENKYLWNKIQIITKNKNINLLLYMNKVGSDYSKAYVEYIAYEKPIFLNSDIELMIKTVNDFNFFFVNSSNLISGKNKYFELKIKYKDKEVIIDLSEEVTSKDENEENKNNKECDNKNEENKDDEENKNNKENDNNKNNKNRITLKNKNNIFNRINLDCESYDYFICSIEDSAKIENYQDFIEFLTFIKLNYNALITIEYTDISNIFSNKESMTSLNRIYLLTDIFLLDNKDTIANFKKHYEIFEKEKKIEDKEENKIENNIEKNKNEEKENDFNEEDQKSEIPIKEVKKIYLEKDENKSVASRKINNGCKTSNNRNMKVKNNQKLKEKFETSEKELYDYFKRKITCNGALSILNTKLGIFLDDNFSKLTFIEVPLNTKALTLTYEIKPYPKLSHTTVYLVDQFKNTLRKNRNFFKSVLYGGLLHKITQSRRKNFGIEVLYPSFLIAHEILKRILIIFVNNMSLPENQQYYIVKINSNDIKNYINQTYLDKKENKFVLDCTNVLNSKLKSYVPLFDRNLHEFFENKAVQNDLFKKGFINSKKFINYDPVYRKEMRIPKLKKCSSFSEQNIVRRQLESNNKNTRLRIIMEDSPTNVKLPIIPCKVTDKVNFYNRLNKLNSRNSYNKKYK